jgi:hypothetical protein
MRHLVTADWHIKMPRKKAEQEWYIKQIDMFTRKLDDIINLYKVTRLDILGDIFDMKPTYLDIGILLKIFNDLLYENPELEINVIHGNHDFYRKDFYLLPILPYLSNRVNLHFQVKEHENILYVDNPYVRYGGKIPEKYDKIVFSHIACSLPQFNKEAEYDFNELTKFRFVILGDIHKAYKIEDNILYTSSPFQTYKKTIHSLDEIDNSFHGVIVFDDRTLEYLKIELNLPNKYKLLTNTPPDEEKLKSLPDYIEVEYMMTLEELTASQLTDINNVKIIKKSDIDLSNTKSNREIVDEYLQQKFEIIDTSPYISLLEKVYPDFFRGS